MISRFLHALAARPRIYDAVQHAVGAPRVRERMRATLARLDRPTAAARLAVDVGGGTGLNRAILPAKVRYLCLDPDALKLRGFQAANPEGLGVLGDGLALPLATSCADMVLVTAVVHHIPDEGLAPFFQECARILKPRGLFVFLDPVWSPQRRVGRWLWKYDRGSYPRGAADLRAKIEDSFVILHWEAFAVVHEYALCIAAPREKEAERG